MDILAVNSPAGSLAYDIERKNSCSDYCHLAVILKFPVADVGRFAQERACPGPTSLLARFPRSCDDRCMLAIEAMRREARLHSRRRFGLRSARVILALVSVAFLQKTGLGVVLSVRWAIRFLHEEMENLERDVEVRHVTSYVSGDVDRGVTGQVQPGDLTDAECEDDFILRAGTPLSSFFGVIHRSAVDKQQERGGAGEGRRVGNELGAGQPERAKLAAMVALGCAFLIGIFNVAWTSVLRHHWAGLFTQEPSLVALAASVMPIVGLCELGNCPQTTGCGVLRGTARPTIGVRINLASFYGVGTPIAVWLAFWLGVGFSGLWYGLLSAQFACAVLVLFVVLRRTDWMVEAHRAKKLTQVEMGSIDGADEEKKRFLDGGDVF
ncbi:hypothetical protein ACLOJK_033247 [Asimina triloba]